MKRKALARLEAALERGRANRRAEKVMEGPAPWDVVWRGLRIIASVSSTPPQKVRWSEISDPFGWGFYSTNPRSAGRLAGVSPS